MGSNTVLVQAVVLFALAAYHGGVAIHQRRWHTGRETAVRLVLAVGLATCGLFALVLSREDSPFARVFRAFSAATSVATFPFPHVSLLG